MKILGYLASGQKVIDRQKSHLDSHASAKPYLAAAFAKISLPEYPNFSMQAVEFENDIGHSERVATDDTDSIVYARRLGRSGYTRFVKNRKPIATSVLTVILSATDEDTGKKYDTHSTYVLWNAFIGSPAPREPTDSYFKKNHGESVDKDYAESVQFWDSHALVIDEESIEEGSETSEKPW